MRRLKYLVEYGLLRVLQAFITAPPLSTAIGWGEALGTRVGKVMSSRDRLIVANLTAAFPEKSASDIRSIADAVWKNIGRLSVEFIRAREIVKDPVEKTQIVEGLDILAEAFAQKRGVIIVAAHYCNWEINGIILHRLVRGLGRHFTAIARPMRNPRAEAWVQSRRAEGGIPIILHRQAVKASLRVLRAGESIGILVDQNLYTGGVFTKFFGRAAATTPLPALLHSRTGSPVIFTHLARVDGRYRIRFERVDLTGTPGDADLVGWSQAINDRLEAAIRVRPEWWFWIHNRWKRSAEAAALAPAA